MRLIELILVAWLANWLTMPPSAQGTGTAVVLLNGVTALTGGVIFGTVAWAFVRRRPREESAITTAPTFWMIVLIALLGFGRAYGKLRDAGISSIDADKQAMLGWPGVLILIAIGGALMSLGKAKNPPEPPAQ